MTATINASELQLLLDKQALHELNTAYARGVDRADRALLESLWHPDATVDAGVFVGSGQEFSEAMTAPNEAMARSAHVIANEWFEVDGDNASGESYVVAFTTVIEDGQPVDNIVGGRYLDRCSRRDGVWKFDRRLFVLDYHRVQPGGGGWDEGIFALMQNRGRRDRSDPLYRAK